MNEKGKLIALELPDGEGRTVEVVAELEDLADNNIIFSMVPPEKLRCAARPPARPPAAAAPLTGRAWLDAAQAHDRS